jgi:CHAD domain-containing protein
MAVSDARSTGEMKATLERELKLGAGPRFRLPALPGEPLALRTLTNIYLDTPDHRLAVAGVTLRRRVEGGKSLWQLKLPQGKARLELELPGDASESGRRRSREGRARADVLPPAQMVDLVTVLARGAPLVPVAILRSRRQGVLVRDARGPVAEVVLDSVQVLSGSSTVKRFREIEVELTGGDESDLERLEQALRAAGATDGDGRPKLLRALDIEPAPPPEPTPPEAPAVEQLRAMIEAQVRQIIANDPGTRLGQDPESLHQMRVACRRLRTLLREAGSMLDPEWVEPLREEIGWLGDELGAVRDLDVLRQHLSDEIAALDPADARGGALLIRALEAERGGRREELVAALRSERYFKLLGALEDAARKPQIADPDVSLESVARDAFKRLRKAVRRLGDEPSDEALHEVRIKAKRARYAAELVAPGGDKLVERFIERAKEFQDVLGEYQDAVVARERIRGLAARRRGAASAFVAGRLLERQVARRAEILRRFPKRWRKLEKRGLKAWR